ncbi:MAG: amidohydrolase [Spirochaetales bacterium]
MTTTLWTNARIHTLDPRQPQATALVSRGQKLLYVGDEAGAREKAGPKAKHIDLGGLTVVPGFNDNHLHTVIFGDQLGSVTLEGLDAEAILAKLVAAYPNPAPGELLVAYNWDLPACPHPHRSLLDAAFPDNPVLLAQFGGHGQWLNSAALALVDLDEVKRRNPTGEIERDLSGEPTGLLREMFDNPLANKHFDDLFHKASVREPRVLRALAEFARLGITSIQDNSWYLPMVRQFTKLRREGRLTARVSCWTYATKPKARILMALGNYDAHWVRQGPWKYFLDGTFSTRTALLHEPYEVQPGGPPDNRGQGHSKDEIVPILRYLAKTGRQGAFHAIGDRVITNFVEAAYEVQAEFPQLRTLRLRLEHAQLIRQDDLASLRELGILVSAQPSALSTPEKDVSLVGEERALSAYPYRSLLDAGVDLSFGSDIPGEPSCNPLAAIARVSTRPGPERITVQEALEAYTVGSAWAEKEEDWKGRLKAGMYADFAVLSDDILAIAPAAVADTKVVRTVVGGKTVYWAE